MAIRATLTARVRICVVRGFGPSGFAAYRKGAVQRFGLGTGLYHPDDTAAQVRPSAEAEIAAFPAA